MGYPSLTCIYHKGELVAAHQAQFNGCPDIQGADILQFLRIPENIEKLKNSLQFVDHDASCYYDRQGDTLPNLPDSLSSHTSGAELLHMITQPLIMKNGRNTPLHIKSGLSAGERSLKKQGDTSSQPKPEKRQ
jgi:hypothetical protein